ncbi:hypothetical protein [Dulcicalothrix desertica]|nr:hypothetical protein [Dulcicalothrix desertica]TWH39854.1 hypothetical protein CAL7102_09117 [Dulcicalothrix desertica PCC 7102]
MEQTGVTSEKFEVAKHHGANVARVTAHLQGKNLLATRNIGIPR